MSASLQRMVRDASPEARYQIERLLRQDADDRAWAEQLGPAYRQGDVARLLDKSRQAVSADRGLLRLALRDGDIAYPVFQFDGRRQLPGIREVVRVFEPAVATTWTTASWLTSPAPELDDRTPLALLRAGELEPVISLARQTASTLQN
ncbi:MAG: hypothetical protein U5L08_10290 [Xanthomonadales bacterium]|nr:hypothetical protein [Xanthomonadales bacterium]